MRGQPFEELAQSAARSAVVLLIAAEGECYSLILRLDEQIPLIIKFSNITPDELTTMSLIASAAQMRGSVPPDSAHDDRIGMKISSSGIYSNPALAKLWTVVVKPVIDCLQLQVGVTGATSEIDESN
jgi:hypothetical protein